MNDSMKKLIDSLKWSMTYHEKEMNDALEQLNALTQLGGDVADYIDSEA